MKHRFLVFRRDKYYGLAAFCETDIAPGAKLSDGFETREELWQIGPDKTCEPLNNSPKAQGVMLTYLLDLIRSST